MKELREHFRRVVRELCAAIGLEDAELLLSGGQLRIDKFLVAVLHEEASDPGHAVFYVDLDTPSGDELDAFRRLLALNFDLGAGARGVMSLHPETGHVLYALRHPLGPATTGERMLDLILRFIAGLPAQDEAQPQAFHAAGADRLSLQLL